MSIPTNKNIKAVAYNGVNIPLAGTVPTDTITITQNGTDIDASSYAPADIWDENELLPAQEPDPEETGITREDALGKLRELGVEI